MRKVFLFLLVLAMGAVARVGAAQDVSTPSALRLGDGSADGAARIGLEPAAVAVQSTSTRRAMSTAKARTGIRVYGIVEGESLAATKSFQAILDSGQSTLTLGGVGFDVVNLWGGLFARVSFTTASAKGTRVFIDNSQVAHSLHIPLTVQITPLEIGAGWRFGRPTGSVTATPFIGAAILMQHYKETSDFADDSENTDATDQGETVFGGVEVGFRAVKFLKIGVEGGYRNVPNALGTSGASQAFGEKNLGGAMFRLTFGVGF